MYSIRTEQSFDAAHFLAGYQGKCSNLHGHRWRVAVRLGAEELEKEGQLRGMVADFGDIKSELKRLTEAYDHTFIYEAGSLRVKTVQALTEEGFCLVEVPFRPTAENFAGHFYRLLRDKGFPVQEVEVYETPNNCAAYTED